MRKLLLLVFVLSTQILTAQNNQKSIFTNGDKLYINLSDQSDVYYTHIVEKGHTVYSLSRAYKVSADKLYAYNSLEKNATISLGQKLMIPISGKELYKGTSLDNITQGHYIPVYYKTLPKDNLFRISRVYFKQPIDDLIVRNKLTNKNLSLGQDLLIGWLLVDGKLPSTEARDAEYDVENFDLQNQSSSAGGETVINSPLPSGTENQTNDEIENDSTELAYPIGFNPSLLGSMQYAANMKVNKKSEVAFWDKTIPDNGTVFALHESAIINSYINVFNPLVSRSVRVKVIGRIPYGTYTNDVKLVISPRTAKQLGGLDRRFKVEIDYLTN